MSSKPVSALWLEEASARALVLQATGAAPEEICGLLAGRDAVISEVISIRNAADDPRQTFYMDEDEFKARLHDLERRGLSLIGFYHSHPQGDPTPSPTDIRSAYYPEIPHLLIGLRGRPRLAVWRIKHGSVEPVTLHIGSPRIMYRHGTPSSQLSQAQKVAIVLSAAGAFIFLILLSLALLPPAPPIP
ncbi:MAG: M67 family metallopeptidase [Aggregatilineales bacterium]